MHPLIAKILNKRGIKDVTELSDEEKATFDNWQKILTAEEVTIERLEEFLKELKRKAINEVAEPDNSDKKDAKAKAMITISDALLGLINAPRSAKETIIKHIKQLLEQ